MLGTGRYATIDELAKAEKINPSYVSRVLRLTLLAPDIVEAILGGRQPEGVTLPVLMKALPVSWEEQRRDLDEDNTPSTVLHRHAGDEGSPSLRRRWFSPGAV